MGARLIPVDEDPIRPDTRQPITVVVDGHPYVGETGQTLAGVLLANGRQPRSPRGGRSNGGVFCGIGVCYGCLVTVDGVPDVRACQRRAVDGAVVTTTEDSAADRGLDG